MGGKTFEGLTVDTSLGHSMSKGWPYTPFWILLQHLHDSMNVGSCHTHQSHMIVVQLSYNCHMLVWCGSVCKIVGMLCQCRYDCR